MPEVPATCPHCDAPYRWEVDLHVEQELAWCAPAGPAFAFRCQACGGAVEITLRWRLEQGSHPRHLRLLGGPTPLDEAPCILLVDRCPHGCGALLGLRLEPDDPWARGVAWPDAEQTLGGYRCPRCDGEGRLCLLPVVGVPE